MEDVPLHVRMNMWIQHDGATPHYALCARQVMNEIFDEKWIGRGGPVAWSPRSRELTEITPQMLAKVRRSFHQRISKCLQVESHHFEHLLWVKPNQG